MKFIHFSNYLAINNYFLEIKKLKNFIPITHITGKVNREGIRKMTPREWARLQGFPDNFKIIVSDAQAYKQFGNSVAVPAIQATAKKIIEKLKTS